MTAVNKPGANALMNEMDESVRAIAEARLAEAERKIERLLAQGEQVHTLRHYPDGRTTAIVSPVGRLFTDAIEVDVQKPIL